MSQSVPPPVLPWTGRLPSEWDTRRAKYLFRRMQRPPGEDDGIVTCFRDGEVTLRENRRAEGFTNAEKEGGYQGVRAGDLVIHSMDAFAGAIGVSDSDGKSTPVYSVCAPRDASIDVRYYAYALRHMARADYILALARGVRERSTEFRYTQFQELRLPLPPAPQQRAIADFLDRETEMIDALIAKKQRLINLLEERRRAMISHAVTKGLDSDAPMKDSGVEWLGKIPAHWAVSRFARAVEVKEGPGILAVDFVDEGVPLIPVGALSSGQVDLSRCHHLDEFATELRWSRFRVRTGDLLISTSASVGLTCEVDEGCEGAVPYTGVIRLRPHGHLVSQRFVKYVVQSQLFIEQVDLLRTGVAIRHFGPSHLARVNVALPPHPEQEAIADALDASVKEAQALTGMAEKALTALAEYRSALITAAVTGQIDVLEKELVS